MLTRIAISNYRCFRAVDLALQELTLLIGRNGTGKSTVLDVIAAIRELVVNGAHVDQALVGEPRDDGNTMVQLELDFDDLHLLYRVEVDLHAAAPHIHSEEVVVIEQDGSHTSRYRAVAGQVLVDGRAIGVRMKADTSPLAALDLGVDHPCSRFNAWLQGVWLLRLIPQDMGALAEEPADHLDATGDNFSAWLLGLGQDQRQALPPICASTIPGLTNLEFEQVGRASVLTARFDRDLTVDFDELSDGQRALIVLHAVLVLVGDATLLLLDEPDAHVTATEILPLVSRIREATEAGRVQAVVASHHPHMLDLLASDDVVELAFDASGLLAARRLSCDQDSLSPSRYILLRGA